MSDVVEEPADDRPFLKWAAVAFAIGFSVHAVDHFRRGLATTPTRVVIVGTIQGLFAVLAVWMALKGSDKAPIAALVVGFGSALLFTSGHLLPMSPDSYVAPPLRNVTWFSWLSAFAEIGTRILFGIAGLRARLNESREVPRPRTV